MILNLCYFVITSRSRSINATCYCSVFTKYCTRQFHLVIMSDKPVDLLNCVVCLEEYQDSGSHVPKLLPCTHTLCEKCLIELLGQQGGAKLTCQEWRTYHVAPEKQRTFPQNKYLLSFIKWRDTTQSKKSEEEFDGVSTKRLFPGVPFRICL